LFIPVKTRREDMLMKKAKTGKIKFVKEDTSILAVEIGREMNHG